MSERWEEAIRSCKVHLRNFRVIQEQNQALEKELQKLEKDVQALTALQVNNKTLTQHEARSLLIEALKQPKLIEEKTLQLSASLEKKLHRVEQSLPPALGFIKPSEYSSTIASGAAIIKQNNLQLQLLTQISEGIKEIHDDLKGGQENDPRSQKENFWCSRTPSKSFDRINKNHEMTTKTRTTQEAPTTPLVEDQIREYRHNQRHLYNLQQVSRRMGQRIMGRTATQHTLEQQLNPQEQLRLSMRERVAIAPAEVLYHSRRDDANHRVYIHRSEEAILCTDNHQVDQTFIQEESFHQLQRSKMQYIHLGVLQVRLQILHRQEEGTLALVLFHDNQWQDDRSIIATMEVDLARGSQLIYVIPDIMMTIGDFFRNIHLTIATKGYETWKNGEANFLITRGLIGRLSITPNVAFAYEVNGVVDYLTSHGVIALPGRRYSARQLQGQNWVICPTNVVVPLQPNEVSSSNLLDGRLSISFSNYRAAPFIHDATYSRNDDEALSDEEELRLHTVAVLIEEGLLVKRLYPSAALPRRTTAGAAGYDLPLNRAQDIPANSRTLLTTGLSIKAAKGTYARITARSGAALKKGILIGAEVIDSDYREVYEVDDLNETARGHNAFGSTSGEPIGQLQQQLTTTWLKSLATSFIPDDQSSTESTPTKDMNPRTWYSTINMPMKSHDAHSTSKVPQWEDIVHILCPQEQDENASHRFPLYGTHAGDARPGPSVHRSMEYPIMENDEFLTTIFEESSTSEAEYLQDCLNSYFSNADEVSNPTSSPSNLHSLQQAIKQPSVSFPFRCQPASNTLRLLPSLKQATPSAQQGIIFKDNPIFFLFSKKRCKATMSPLTLLREAATWQPHEQSLPHQVATQPLPCRAVMWPLVKQPLPARERCDHLESGRARRSHIVAWWGSSHG
ncbi:hypothetical protein ZIOFF_015540 [Zingiber officinale]|uniref:dUTP diphosphatase n=1 Tax=Zingiber officinale TaxID=94328 RepID=A0A8J5HEE8_ZINOF|nr:hypothetical protein ZIOFF_015540 [Zingiber officinale]